MPRQPVAPRPGDEAGFTLIELVVSLVLLTVGVFSLMQVFYSGLRVTLSADSRTRATAVASREVESVRAGAYATVGMATALIASTTYTDTDGTQYQYVTGGATAPSATQTVSGTVFTIRRAIVWSGVDTNPQADKRIIVISSWNDAGGTHSVRQDSTVYPGGLPPFASSTTTTSTTSTTLPNGPAAPTALTAHTDAAYPTSVIDLSWTANAPLGTTWEVDHSIDPSFNSVTVDTTNLPVGQTTFQKTGLGAATTFYFRVRAIAAGSNSSWSAIASAATQASAQAACSIGTANVTPAAVNKANNGNGGLSSDLYVSASSSGTCTALQLRFTPSVLVGQVVVPLTKQTNGVWDHTIFAADFNWDTGNRTLTVVDGNGNALASIALLVCAKGNTCP